MYFRRVPVCGVVDALPPVALGIVDVYMFDLFSVICFKILTAQF